MKHEVVKKILDVGLLPVFYNDNVEVEKKIIQACAEGGAIVVEYTNRGDFAHQIFKETSSWSQNKYPDIILGAGTIIEPATAALYINYGANFIVSPVFNPDVVKICNRHKIAYIPGCMTPTEISNAEEMRVDIVKILPGKTVAPSFIKAILVPCPLSKLMPSGGVELTQENVSDWIKSGASALNIGFKSD